MTVSSSAITSQVRDRVKIMEPYNLTVADLYRERILRKPVLGGLINQYARAA